MLKYLKNHLYIVLYFIICVCLLYIILLVSDQESSYTEIVNNHQYVNNSNLRINLFVFQGNVLWKYVKVNNNINDIISALNDLPPEKSYFVKFIVIKSYLFFEDYYLVYPEFENFK